MTVRLPLFWTVNNYKKDELKVEMKMERKCKLGKNLSIAAICFAVLHIVSALVRMGILVFMDVTYLKVIGAVFVKEIIFAIVLITACIVLQRKIVAGKTPEKKSAVPGLAFLLVFVIIRGFCSLLTNDYITHSITGEDSSYMVGVTDYLYTADRGVMLSAGMMLIWAAYFIYINLGRQDIDAVVKTSRNYLIVAASVTVLAYVSVWLLLTNPAPLSFLVGADLETMPSEPLSDYYMPNIIGHTLLLIIGITVMFLVGKRRKKVGIGLTVVFSVFVALVGFVVRDAMKGDLEDIMMRSVQYALEAGITIGEMLSVISVAEKEVNILSNLFTAALYLCIAAYVSYAVVQSKENAEKESVSE